MTWTRSELDLSLDEKPVDTINLHNLLDNKLEALGGSAGSGVEDHQPDL